MQFKKLPSGMYAVIINDYIEVLTPEEFKKLKNENTTVRPKTLPKRWIVKPNVGRFVLLWRIKQTCFK